MTNNSLQIEQQKLAQLQGIHYQLSRIADILGNEFGERPPVNTAEIRQQIAAANERRQ